MELTGCKISTNSRYQSTPDRPNYFLEIKMPLPGGEATYRIEITRDQKDSIDVGIQLSKGDKK